MCLIKKLFSLTILIIFLSGFISGCADKNVVATNFEKNDLWRGDIQLTWDKKQIVLTGSLNYTGLKPLKEVKIIGRYKETQLRLPGGYTLPYKNIENKITMKQPEKTFQLYDNAQTYETVSKELSPIEAKLILANLVFDIEFEEQGGNRKKTTIYIAAN